MADPLKIMYITSPFGWRIHPVTRKWTHHDGVDLRAHFTDAFARLSGTVDKVLKLGAYGRQIFLSHPDGSLTHYAHLDQTYLSKGDKVQEGQTIAITGNTGSLTTAPHLHFGIKINGEWVDPMQVLLKGKVTEAIEKEVIIEGNVYKGLEINGLLWVLGRETHEAVGNQVNWTEKGTEIIPVPKMKLKLINELSSQK